MRFCYASLHGPLAKAGLERAAADLRSLGFDGLALGLRFGGDAAGAAISEIAGTLREADLTMMLDICLEQPEGLGRNAIPAAWQVADPTEIPPPDPRRELVSPRLRWHDPAARHDIEAWWSTQLAMLAQKGVRHFRCRTPHLAPHGAWRAIAAALHAAEPGATLHAWTPGLTWDQITHLLGAGFAGGFLSTAWWDGRAAWLADEAELLDRLGPALSLADVPSGEHLAPTTIQQAAAAGAESRRAAALRALDLAAGLGNGLFAPINMLTGSADDAWRDDRAGEPFPLADEALRERVKAANRRCALVAGLSPPRRAHDGAAIGVFLRTDTPAPGLAAAGVAVAVNNGADAAGLPATAFGSLRPAAGHDAELLPLEPGEVRLIPLAASRPVIVKRPRPAVDRWAQAPRIAIEHISGAIDGGRFAAKRIVGHPVAVEADIFSDGHDLIAAELLWRPADERDWRRVAMEPMGNDRWRAVILPGRVGRHLVAIEAWQDVFGSLQHALRAKIAAEVDIAVELEEARLLVEAALARAPDPDLARLAERLGGRDPASADMLLSAAIGQAMAARDPRKFLTRSEPQLPFDIERPQAAFASWYELFPRSVTDDPHRHGTLRDVIGRLPAIRAMGFDVLYFPPIHPIGRKNRKGRNNSLTAAPGDVGSPYAIGAAEGGHDAILPALGTLDDFRALVAAAQRQGLEIALDFAIQCAPDHPWLTDHPDWFQRRPDGTIRYAENPPKKYEDIVNVDFYAPAAIPALWLALRDVVRFWIDQGVRMFRVDNPHTKPLPFWEWMIADIRNIRPDVIFLSEAFTRPKMMYRLAKVGFSQSYTYFTWRNTKAEIASYVEELSTAAPKDYFRPHFFVNTPDINPFYLQTSGRPGFLVRAALAATLSGLWGVYSGFELCEAAPLPGREEYRDSEKYELRPRDDAAPGNIVAEIAQLNRLRRHHAALQTHLDVRFYNAFNDAILYYGKGVPSAGALILVLVNLDPHGVQACAFEVPLWEWGLPDHETVEVEDLWRGERFSWNGKIQHIRLDPQDLPFAIFRIAPRSGGRP